MSKLAKAPLKAKKPSPASLKSRSGAGFSFEDKVAAMLMAEMLGGVTSLGRDWSSLETVERQAADWEPFGDVLLTAKNANGDPVKCGGSVKSNRPITANGAGKDLRAAIWAALARPAMRQNTDVLGLFTSDLSQAASDVLESVSRQSRNVPPERLPQKITAKNERTVLESFRGARNAPQAGAAGVALAHLVHRAFDFEKAVSRSEAAALELCQKLLQADGATSTRARDLWKALVQIAETQRVSGGVVSRESLAGELRRAFTLADDPGDQSTWAKAHEITHEAMARIEVSLPGNINLPRKANVAALRKELTANRIVHFIGDSGSGKSALIKQVVVEDEKTGTEVIWVGAEQFPELLKTASGLSAAARRTRKTSALLVVDALDACYDDDTFRLIALTVAGLVAGPQSVWKVILICQTGEWSRVSRQMLPRRHLTGPNSVAGPVVCGDLSLEDMAIVCTASKSIRALYGRPELRRMLSSPKVLDVLLSGQIADNRPIAGEADLVDWWWDDAVRRGKPIAEEERVARLFAAKMADDLTSELSPDAVEAPALAVEALIQRRVLSRTKDGRLRFEHDLLADWSRVRHLRSLGDSATEFMRAHVANPPWLRAIRLFSQHLFERDADLPRWRAVLVACQPDLNKRDQSQAENLQVIDPWLEGIAFAADSAAALTAFSSDLLAQEGWLLRRLLRRLLYSATLPDPILLRRLGKSNPKDAAALARQFRLPIPSIWTPVVAFLVQHSNEATDFTPVELAELAEMWERWSEYTEESWRPLADLILLNAERELRAEVATNYRNFASSRRRGGGKIARGKIYSAALAAAGQNPPRAAKLALKAAGRAPWEPGNVDPNALDEWNGKWTRNQFDMGSGEFVKSPPESWPDGPRRMISKNFFEAWFSAGSTRSLYHALPKEACEATLAFMIDWPKAELRDRHSALVERFGFAFETGQMRSALWRTGPYILFLRGNWEPALEMIVRLVNFATERYEDWWPYEPKVETLTIKFDSGAAVWRGNEHFFLVSHGSQYAIGGDVRFDGRRKMAG